MGTGTDHRTLVDLAYIVWTFDGSQPSHRPINAHSFTAWASTRGTSTAASAPPHPDVVRNPRLTVRCEYPDSGMAPTEVTFALSPRYGIHTAREAHDWFLKMMAENEEFEVEVDRTGEPPMPFWSETVRQVVVE